MHDPARDFVLRALAASEIAESCSHPALKTRFQDLVAYWLRKASEAEAGARPDRRFQMAASAASR